MNMAAWLQKQLNNTELDTQTYLRYYNELEDIKFRQRVLDAEYERRISSNQNEIHQSTRSIT